MKKFHACFLMAAVAAVCASCGKKTETAVSAASFKYPNQADKFEAELGVTKRVNIPFSGTGTLVAEYPDGSKREFAVGDADVFVPTEAFTAVGQTIKLAFAGSPDTGVITCVEPEPNRPDNSLWIGAKTADELAFGEWTMDLDVAKEKVAKTEGEAYTLVAASGVLWCPDCFGIDTNILETAAFEEFAKKHNVACVQLDIALQHKDADKGLVELPAVPDKPVPYPSQLTYVEKLVEKKGGVVSGISYLSRHGLTEAEGAAVLDRNTKLASEFRIPESETLKLPTYWVPSVFILRKDGSMLGRIECDALWLFGAEVGVRRFEELLALDSVATEPEDNYRGTTKLSIADGATVQGEVSAFDVFDVWKLEGSKKGSKVKLSVKSADGKASFVASVQQVVDGKTVVVGEALSGSEIDLEAVLPLDSDTYVSISGNKPFYGVDRAALLDGSYSDPAFAVGSPESTIRGYTVAYSVGAAGADEKPAAFVPLAQAPAQAKPCVTGAAPAEQEPDAEGRTDIDWAKALEMRDAGAFFVDVRNPDEVAQGAAPKSVNIPLGEIDARLAEFPKDQDIVVYCKGGVRSVKASNKLLKAGYTRVFNVLGGFDAFPKQD